jgi:hypothetical protein
VWRILYPIEFREQIEAKAAREGLDRGARAALICQESTFEPAAVSRAGARGLMQVMPVTAGFWRGAWAWPTAEHAARPRDDAETWAPSYLRQMLDALRRTHRARGGRLQTPGRTEWRPGPAGQPDIGKRGVHREHPVSRVRRAYVMTCWPSRGALPTAVLASLGTADAPRRPVRAVSFRSETSSCRSIPRLLKQGRPMRSGRSADPGPSGLDSRRSTSSTRRVRPDPGRRHARRLHGERREPASR